MNIHYVGYLGLFFLVSAYAVLPFKKARKWFTLLDILGSVLLTLYAILEKDLVFILVNGFISFVLIYRFVKGDLVK